MIIILSCHEILSIFIVYESGWWFGTMEFYDFPFIGNNNPNWLSYFSEGLKPPTNIHMDTDGVSWGLMPLKLMKTIDFIHSNSLILRITSMQR